MSQEQTPLLGRRRKTSFISSPLFQIILIFLGRIGEATTFTVAFPFVNFMIVENGIVNGPEAVGYIAGLVEGIFPFAEFITVVPWSKLSDRIGRKPVVVIALTSVAVAAPLFGLSRSLWGMLITRAIAGGFNGNIAVTKTMMIELTDENNRALVLSLDPVAWCLGSIVGPWLGGYLSKPGDRWPGFVEKFPIFEQHPYFLPCLAAAMVPGISAILSILFLKETLVINNDSSSTTTKKVSSEEEPLLQQSASSSSSSGSSSRNIDDNDNEQQEDQQNEGQEQEQEQVGKMTPVAKTQTKLLIATSAIYAFISMAAVVLAPLLAFTPISSGGLELSAEQIGTTLSISRFASLIAIQLIGFPFVVKHFAALKVFRFQLTIWLILFVIYPALNPLAAQHVPALTITGLSIIQVVQSFADASFVTGLLVLGELVPTSIEFNSYNAVLQSAICLVRSFAPPISTAIFALSTQYKILWGFGVWVLLEIITIVVVAMVWIMRDPKSLILINKDSRSNNAV